MKLKLQENRIEKLIFAFFVFASLFPTFRILTIGSKGSTTFFEYIFSILPEMFFGFIFLSGIIIVKDKIKFEFLDWIVICFTLSNALIGTFLAKNIMLSMYGIRLTYYPMLLYVIVRFWDIKHAFLIFNKILSWFFIIGIIGLILYFGFYDSMVSMIKRVNPIVSEYFIVRMTSVFWTPVVFSTFMVIIFTYYYNKFLTDPRFYHYILLGIIWCCIILSVTRGALIVLLIGFIILTITNIKWKYSFQILIMLVLIFIILGYYISTPLDFLFWNIRSASETVSLKHGITRVDLWIKAFENFNSHPLGFGLGKAGHIAARFFTDKTQDVDIYSTDGWYLKLANETGIWGLFSYFFLLIFLSIEFFKNRIIIKTEKEFIWIITVFIMVNIHNLVSNVLDFYLFSYLYWGIIGLAANIMYNKTKLI